MKKFVICVFCVFATMHTKDSYGQQYSSDLNDVERLHSSGSFTPIGKYGDVTKIIDFRGFVPLSAVSKKRDTLLTLDIYQYYKFPLRTLRELYHGPKELRKYKYAADDPLPDDYDQVTKYFDWLPILEEGQLAGEDQKWATFANEITRGESGARLYKNIFDSGGFENAEPIAILMTRRNVFVIVNLRWSSINRSGTGQTLIALEFSAASYEYRECHSIYNTSSIPNNRVLTNATSVFLKEMLALYMKKL